MFRGAFQGKRVWVSGDTGFKGAWLARWLLELGAEVHGYSLPPPTEPSVYDLLGLGSRIKHETGDIRNTAALEAAMHRAQPDFVFHLAAQPLVRLSYQIPLETFATNVMGTGHVLDVLRKFRTKCTAIFVTTDKCYENREEDYAYSENDPLGGHDPYSASKAAAEILIGAYRRSFFGNHPVRIASARAGNVIGGGDWAPDRIVPDCIRALELGQPIRIRNPHATRPWQHVLEPLSGYLWLAAVLDDPSRFLEAPSPLPASFNFGPETEANRPVRDLVKEVHHHWPGEWVDESDPNAPHEARLLMLSTALAKAALQWRPAWDFETAVAETVQWYRGVMQQTATAESLTFAQIKKYESAARERGIAWARE